MTASHDPATIDCKTVCVNGCVLGDRCPHLNSAKEAIDFVMNTDWEELMRLAEDKTSSQDPMSILDNYSVGGYSSED